ncbi:MAG TPA: hypothetical protein VIU61_20990 [Kofleriaceae bacterium]
MLARSALAVLLITTHSGCALLASANAAHSHISPCVSDTTFAGIDLVVGSVGAAALAAGGTAEESPGWLALPGLFLLSGIVGGISAVSCAGKSEQGAVAMPTGSSQDYRLPSLDRTDSPPVQLLVPASAGDPDVKLELDHDVEVKTDEPIPCTTTPMTICPADHSCVFVEKDRGYCRPDR